LADAVTVRYRSLPADEAKVASLFDTFKGKLAAYDQILAKQKYVAGDVSIPFFTLQKRVCIT
jgi:hypothetical protein